MGRVLAVDYGEKRIGLALSDETKTIASGLAVIPMAGIARTARTIAALVTEREVERIIVGNPISMKGRDTKLSLQAQAFKTVLENVVKVPVELVDERFTTAIAERCLHEAYAQVSARKHPVDKVAATILLEDYLERIRK
jgi:putative Holliday junction resolvase